MKPYSVTIQMQTIEQYFSSIVCFKITMITVYSRSSAGLSNLPVLPQDLKVL